MNVQAPLSDLISDQVHTSPPGHACRGRTARHVCVSPTRNERLAAATLGFSLITAAFLAVSLQLAGPDWSWALALAAGWAGFAALSIVGCCNCHSAEEGSRGAEAWAEDPDLR